MVIPKQPSARQEDLIEYLINGNPNQVSNFVRQNSKAMSKFFKRHDPEFEVDDFIRVLNSGVPQGEQFCQSFIRNCMTDWAYKMPEKNLNLPPELRQEYRRVRKETRQAKKAEKRAKTWQDARTEWNSLKRAGNNFRAASLAMKPVYAAQFIADGIAGSLSALNLSKPQRIFAQTVMYSAAAAPIVLKSAFSATMFATVMGTTLDEANASIPNTSDSELSVSVKNSLNQRFGDTASPHVLSYAAPELSAIERTIRGILNDAPQNSAEPELTQSPYTLSPYLLVKLETDPKARQYTQWCFDAARKHNIDPVLFTNQIFRESTHFNENVINGERVSAKGAIGIAQFMPATAEIYGLSVDDLTNDPAKALDGAAAMMAEKTLKYGGDQLLALAAYNGGDGAVSWVQDERGNTSITHRDWLNFMEERRENHPTQKAHAYQNETYAYIMDISNIGWDQNYKNWAQRLTNTSIPAELASTLGIPQDSPENSQISLNQLPIDRIPIPQAPPTRPQNG